MVRTRSLLDAGALFAVIAALIHAWVTPEHFEEWWGYGLFFLIVAIAQGLLAMVLLSKPQPSHLVAGIAANAGIIVFYIVTRTSGIPIFGPDAGEVEDMGVLDLTSIVAEVALVAVLATVLARRQPVTALRAGPVATASKEEDYAGPIA